MKPDVPHPPRRPERGGGCLVAAGLVVGPMAGFAFGEPSLGLVIGGLVGAVLAAAIALADRRR